MPSTPAARPEPLLLITATAAARIGISAEQFRNWRASGTLHTHGSPSRLMFSSAELRAVIEGRGPRYGAMPALPPE